MDQQIRDRRVLHQDLSVAIKNGELSLHYQPQAASGPTVAASEVIGFEALARWMHPVRGFVSPGDFIPLAEESGLIVEMGEWILREACREAASWPVPLQIAVNLSPAQFMHGDVVSLGAFDPARNRAGAGSARARNHRRRADRGFRSRPRAAAAAQGARRAHLDGRFRQRLFLAELSAGVPVRQDQDRPRLRHAISGRNPQSAAIVRAVIDLGHGLEMSIVAEGVETQEQLGFLSEEGCDAVQGYLIGKPAPIGQFAALVGAHQQCHGARVPQDRLTSVRCHGGLRSPDYRRRVERCQHGARRCWTRPARDPAGAGRSRRRLPPAQVFPATSRKSDGVTPNRRRKARLK